MDTWMKVASALMLGMMVVYLLPRAKIMLKTSPKASAGDWKSVALPLLGVVLFILLLIMLVRH